MSEYYDKRYFCRKPGVCGGRVTFAGRRIEPWHVTDRLAAGESWVVIGADLNLSAAQIKAAMRYKGTERGDT